MKLTALSGSIMALLMGVTTSSYAEEPTSTEQPNILLFFVDDMGWASRTSKDPIYETPNIDQLSKDGLEFESTYIATPTCSPSRATLLTGQHPARIKMPRHIPHQAQYGFDKKGRTDQKWNLWPKDPAQVPSVNWLDLEYTTYAEALKEQGYYNLFVGKWHLGDERYHPIHQGFDKQIGTSNWGHPRSYYPPYFKSSDVYKDVKDRYLTDKLTDDAVSFLETYDKKKPFMLSMWYYAIHTPFEGRKDLVKHFEEKGLRGKHAQHAALVSGIDESIGRIRTALKAQGLDKNTMVIFLSDQGGILNNKPFRGGKMIDTLYEGGSRVPFIVSWPGVTKPGTKNTSLVQSTDLFPTFVEIAGGDTSKYQHLDGVSLLNTIKQNSKLDRGEPLFGYRAYQDLYATVREGDWKLAAFRSGNAKLYNIADDISESTDVSRHHEEKVNELVKKLTTWEKEMGVEEYSGFKK